MINLLILDRGPADPGRALQAQLERLGRSRGWTVATLPVGCGVLADDLDAVAMVLAACGADERDVTLFADDLIIPDGAVLTIVEDGRRPVSALVRGVDGQTHTAGVATEAGAVVAAATGVHPVADPDASSLGVLRISAAAACPVAADLRAAATTARVESWDDLDLADAILSAVVRTGPTVAAVRLDPYDGGRATSMTPATAMIDRVAATDEAEVARIRSTRLDDGFYSTFVLRRISPGLTRRCIARGVSANRVTALSAAIGLAAAVGFAGGRWWTLLIGAALLQASLVLDCVDGEIARATRTYSAFGAWLDAATDRVKEYAALAGLAAGAARSGHDLWLLALGGMIVSTVRHMQDFAFAKGVLAAARAPRPDRRPWSDTTPWVRPPGSVPSPATGVSRALTPQQWLRRAIHLPIAERWLILSLGAAVNRPDLALLAYLVLGALAGIWGLLGAVRRTTGPVAAYGSDLRRVLGEYRDDGVLGLLTRERSPSGVVGWLLPSLVTGLEGLILVLAAGQAEQSARVWAFAWFALVAWHRYDIVYRRRDRARPVPVGVSLAGGGWLLRCAVLGGAAFASEQSVVLAVGVVVLGIVYLPESLAAGFRSRG